MSMFMTNTAHGVLNAGAIFARQEEYVNGIGENFTLSCHSHSRFFMSRPASDVKVF